MKHSTTSTFKPTALIDRGLSEPTLTLKKTLFHINPTLAAKKEFIHS